MNANREITLKKQKKEALSNLNLLNDNC